MNMRRPGKSRRESSMKATPSHQEGWLASTISGMPAPGAAMSSGGRPQRGTRTARMWREKKRVNMKSKKAMWRGE
jgi:hypothetical protein